MTFTVRRAEAGDATAIAVCLAALGYATPPALVAEKLSRLGGPSDTVLVISAVREEARVAVLLLAVG